MASDRQWLRFRFRLDCALGKPPPRVVFLHIPKCGGTSVNRHFKWNFGNGQSGLLAEVDSMRGVCAEALARARAAQYVHGHFGWTTLQAVDASAIRFTVVREPFERLRSLYFYARAQTVVDHPVFEKVVACAKALPFEGFCLSEDRDVRALIDNAQARALACDYFPFQEHDRTRLSKAASQNLSTLDFVIDQRDLDRVFVLLAARTGTRLSRFQRRLNETPCLSGKVISRGAFLRDRELSALIAQDLEVFDFAKERSLRS